MCINKRYIAKVGFEVNCGKCYDCITRKISDWATRLHFEILNSQSEPIFLTLTYNDKNLKKPTPTARYASLCKRDLQLFFKRLRKNSLKAGIVHTNNLRYLAVGEYGTQNKRPHYHILLFNADHQQCINAWQKGGQEIGQIKFGDVSEKSISYVVGYALATQANRKHVYKNNLVPEFHLYSNGLGKIYTTGTSAIWHNRRVYEGIDAHFVMVDGQKRPMPRYYVDRIYTPTIKKELKNLLSEKQKANITLTKKQLQDANRESQRKLTKHRKSTSI